MVLPGFRQDFPLGGREENYGVLRPIPPGEVDLKPRILAGEGKRTEAAAVLKTRRSDLTGYFLLLALLFLGMEWYLWRNGQLARAVRAVQRVIKQVRVPVGVKPGGSPVRQRLARLRVAAALLLLLALAGAALTAAFPPAAGRNFTGCFREY